jgi:hypothetical protein
MKKFMSKLGVAGLCVVGTVAPAMAVTQLPVGWDTDLNDAKADAITVAVAFILAIIAIRAIKMLRRG